MFCTWRGIWGSLQILQWEICNFTLLSIIMTVSAQKGWKAWSGKSHLVSFGALYIDFTLIIINFADSTVVYAVYTAAQVKYLPGASYICQNNLCVWFIQKDSYIFCFCIFVFKCLSVFAIQREDRIKCFKIVYLHIIRLTNGPFQNELELNWNQIYFSFSFQASYININVLGMCGPMQK